MNHSITSLSSFLHIYVSMWKHRFDDNFSFWTLSIVHNSFMYELPHSSMLREFNFSVFKYWALLVNCMYNHKKLGMKWVSEATLTKIKSAWTFTHIRTFGGENERILCYTIIIKLQVYARFLTKIPDPVKSYWNQSVCISNIISTLVDVISWWT